MGLDELRRGLLTDPGHARDVVRRVPHEGQQVDHLLRIHSEAGAHTRPVDRLDRFAAAARAEEPDAVRHDLIEILVPGENPYLGAGPRRLDRKRSNQVVGLHPLLLHDRHAQESHELSDLRDLPRKVFRHRGPVGLVRGVLTMAERGGRGVEHHGEMVRTALVQKRNQGVEKREGRARDLALRVPERVPGEGEV